jgi:hypothetical protein
VNAACLLTNEDNAYITEHDWRSLETACRKARMHPIQILQFIAGAAGIPLCRLGSTSLTWKQYQQVIGQLEEYRRRRRIPLLPPADIEDKPITKQAWDLLQGVCRDLGMEWWQAQQVIAEATGIPLSDLECGRLTEQQFMQVFNRLEELENTKTRLPLSELPLPLNRRLLQGSLFWASAQAALWMERW